MAARRRPVDGLRITVFIVAGSRRTKLAGERAVGIKELDSRITFVDHNNAVARRRPVDVLRVSKLPVAGAERAERKGERTVGRIEHLDAVVAAIGHGDAGSVGRERQGRRNMKHALTIAGAGRPERVGHRAVGMECPDDRGPDSGHHQQIARRGIVGCPYTHTLRGQAVKCPVRVVDLDAPDSGVGHGERAPPSLVNGRRHGRRRHGRRRPGRNRLHPNDRRRRDMSR